MLMNTQTLRNKNTITLRIITTLRRNRNLMKIILSTLPRITLTLHPQKIIHHRIKSNHILRKKQTTRPIILKRKHLPTLNIIIILTTTPSTITNTQQSLTTQLLMQQQISLRSRITHRSLTKLHIRMHNRNIRIPSTKQILTTQSNTTSTMHLQTRNINKILSLHKTSRKSKRMPIPKTNIHRTTNILLTTRSTTTPINTNNTRKLISSPIPPPISKIPRSIINNNILLSNTNNINKIPKQRLYNIRIRTNKIMLITITRIITIHINLNTNLLTRLITHITKTMLLIKKPKQSIPSIKIRRLTSQRTNTIRKHHIQNTLIIILQLPPKLIRKRITRIISTIRIPNPNHTTRIQTKRNTNRILRNRSPQRNSTNKQKRTRNKNKKNQNNQNNNCKPRPNTLKPQNKTKKQSTPKSKITQSNRNRNLLTRITKTIRLRNNPNQKPNNTHNTKNMKPNSLYPV